MSYDEMFSSFAFNSKLRRYSVEDDNMAMVELLIKKGAKVDHVNRNGTTRLQAGPGRGLLVHVIGCLLTQETRVQNACR